MSPTFFNIAMNEIIEDVKQEGVRRRMAILKDVTLIAESEE